jgi:hypothetical protein
MSLVETGPDVILEEAERVRVETPAVLYGLMAEFEEHEQLLAAAKHAHASGFRAMDAYSPFPIDGLAEALGREGSMVPFFTLAGGLAGGLGAYFMQLYSMARLYPINVGGRPMNSWPNFVPVVFELTILIASISAVVSMFVMNKLPQPNHPVFNVAAFRRSSIDRFFLCLEASDAQFDREKTRRFLEGLKPVAIEEVLE